METIYEFSKDKLFEVCASVRNFFAADHEKHEGFFSVRNGQIVPSLYVAGANYIRVFGSAKNDGIHSLDETLVDEDGFKGMIWVMRVPEDFLKLVGKIEKWESENAKILESPYTSESFGGYSYSKDTAGASSWQAKFKSRLDVYRKVRA